jgi:hypothetical protein
MTVPSRKLVELSHPAGDARKSDGKGSPWLARLVDEERLNAKVFHALAISSESRVIYVP